MKKAVVAGHICVDITPVFPKQKSIKTEEILSPGKLINMEGVQISTGGAVANTGLGMKVLGADVKLMGKIGNDEFGKIVLDELMKYGYDGSTDMIRSEHSGTSYSVVIAIPGIDRIFLHSPGANNTFRSEDLDYEAIRDAGIFHLGYPPLMKKLYEDDGEETVRIFRKIKEMGVATSLDMAFVDPASEAGQQDWKKIITRLIPYVDFFVPSIEELGFMLDRPRFEEWKVRAAGGDITEILDVEKDVKPLADELLQMGAKVLMIKCGAPGLYYRTAGEEVLKQVGANVELDCRAWADKEGFERSYVPDRILSGTGCGDTCIAAFLTSVLNGYEPEKSMHLAAATGASCICEYDAISGLKPLNELEKRITSGWKKVGDQ